MRESKELAKTLAENILGWSEQPYNLPVYEY